MTVLTIATIYYLLSYILSALKSKEYLNLSIVYFIERYIVALTCIKCEISE